MENSKKCALMVLEKYAHVSSSSEELGGWMAQEIIKKIKQEDDSIDYIFQSMLDNIYSEAGSFPVEMEKNCLEDLFNRIQIKIFEGDMSKKGKNQFCYALIDNSVYHIPAISTIEEAAAILEKSIPNTFDIHVFSVPMQSIMKKMIVSCFDGLILSREEIREVASSVGYTPELFLQAIKKDIAIFSLGNSVTIKDSSIYVDCEILKSFYFDIKEIQEYETI